MFKRSEKKIKVVFKMQFRATQVPQLKSKSLMISLVPVDVGKPTVKLAKTPILEGTCTWENPVYETVKLVKETKTGRIREKFYYVVVSTGSSKAGFLGEVSIDFADLAEATKPLNLSLPLQTSKSGAILHVTVQKMQEGSDSRHSEDSEVPVDDLYDQNLETEVNNSSSFGKRNLKSPESDDLSEATSLHDELNGSLEDSESYSYDSESRDGVKRTSLTNQMKVLERKMEHSELEVQSLRKQITKEIRRGQQLSEQISCLKEEKDALKAECEQLKSSLKCKNEAAASVPVQKETENLRSPLENIKQELQREKQLNKKLKSNLQKTEDSNSEFVLAMRDLSKKLDQKNTEISRLSTKIKDFYSGSEALAVSPRTTMNGNEGSKAPEDLDSKHGNADETEKLKLKIEQLYSEIEVHKKEKAEIQMDLERLTLDYGILETENNDIYSKLEHNEKENMEIQQNYTGSLAIEKQLKLRIASLEAENKRQALQYSESLNMIDELEFQVESLQKELENQTQAFEGDLEAVAEAKNMQEQRAIRAEEALRKTRWSSANAAERLQEEFRQVSAEMTLKIEESDKLAQKAVAEADDLHQKNEVLEELLQKAEEELQTTRNQYDIILGEYQQQKEKVSRDESEQMKTTTEESVSLQRWKLEKDDLERQLASVRKEAEKIMQDNVSMKSQMDQKKTKEENLHLEVKKLRIKNNEVKNHLLELEVEKEDLKKEMSKLRNVLRKKEQEQEKAALQNSATSQMKEKNLKYNTKQVGSNMTTTRIAAGLTEQLEQETAPAQDRNSLVFQGRQNKGKNIKGAEMRVLENLPLQKSGQPGGDFDVSNLLSEVASLKERNGSMEEELKEMHERYSEISLKFAEVEGERQQLVMSLRNLKSGKKN
ncbi:hypothetical protein ABFS82_06G034100 [Erythranthe guttata]|uniref:putative leucine-rich repeat-containing protein DDB_G0290503 isoform X2 n=1 Tax=Erythranthe guttata TaxID=4155 RepID=UPI00064D908F|nr:PREDICTED: putative leucine-rich repeat-containing protein DDB_G0290503 isoform X2 [Erythranthe guttata]|eukprot:XP_012852113.1 PREDICTED: putative leucine-rich repeat-containing protein DDB_G0290503 isoform X2 [Erythranthe guttata]